MTKSLTYSIIPVMRRAIFASILILLGSLAFAGGVKAGLIPPFGGEYINLNGSGLAATFHDGSSCDINFGFCSGNFVLRTVCNGKVFNCDSGHGAQVIEMQEGQAFSIGNPGCDRTVQLDVFNDQFQNGDIPSDYIVWYSGDCVVPTATPTSTPRPTATATPTPSGTLTPTPTPTIPQGGAVVVADLKCPNGTNFGGIRGSNVICVQQTQNQNQVVNNRASASTGPISITLAGTKEAVEELPKTGLPMAAWFLPGLLPLGIKLRKVGTMNKIGKNISSYLWQKREFDK